ncbi:helix-turn-helix domain-containing protein [Enterococcus sp. AZ007]|uniref:helix-turn-helix domain-containing protein n=1 Tax=Enterococcus sp. AZ007 TaxID=2774839 RepID=UPI003F2888E1
MNFLVNKLDRNKIFFIQTIFDSEHHICTLDELLQVVDINHQTANSLFHSILDDIRLSDFSDRIHLNYSPTNQIFELQISQSFNIQTILNFYILRSSKFQLLNSLLMTKFETLQDVADSLHVSYTQVRRIIIELNDSLKKVGLEIYSRRNVYIAGNEINLRFFYTVLYVSIYGIGYWPFSSFSFLDISLLLDECPNEVFKSISLDKNVLTHYYLAVHLLRERQGFEIDLHEIRVPLYEACCGSNQAAFKSFSTAIGKYLPQKSEAKRIENTQLICSSLVALGGYSSVETIPDFFLLNQTLNEQKFSHKAFYIIDRVNYHLSVPLTYEEREKILYSVLCLHYRIAFIGDALNYLETLLPYYSHETNDLRKKHKIQHIQYLVESEMKTAEFDWSRDYHKYLLPQYCLIYDKHLEFEKHTAPITVAFISLISNQNLQNTICQYFSSYFNLKVANKLDQRVDIIISEVPISADAVSNLRLHQPIIHCHQKIVSSDYDKIATALAQIAKKKFKYPQI